VYGESAALALLRRPVTQHAPRCPILLQHNPPWLSAEVGRRRPAWRFWKRRCSACVYSASCGGVAASGQSAGSSALPARLAPRFSRGEAAGMRPAKQQGVPGAIYCVAYRLSSTARPSAPSPDTCSSLAQHQQLSHSCSTYIYHHAALPRNQGLYRALRQSLPHLEEHNALHHSAQ